MNYANYSLIFVFFLISLITTLGVVLYLLFRLKIKSLNNKNNLALPKTFDRAGESEEVKLFLWQK